MLAPPPPADRVLASWKDGLTLVRQNSTSLRTTAARIAESEAIARQALAPALPTLTANAGITRHLIRGEGIVSFSPLRTGDIPDPATAWSASLNLRVPVFAPKAWYDHTTAKVAVENVRLNGVEIERQVLGSVANAIVTVVTAERLAEVSRVSLRSALSTLDLNKRRAALGASSALDVLRVEQEVELARAQVVSADETLLRSREALGLALGTNQSYGVTPDVKLDQLAADARASCKVQPSTAERPDVRAATSGVELAQRRVKSVDWSYWPTVDAVSSLAYYGPEVSSINGKHYTWTIGGLLTWQLYDGGFRYGLKQQSQAQVSLAQEQLTDTKRRADVEVVQAMRSVKVAEANLTVTARRRDIAAETARLSKVAYLNGSGTSFDLVDTAQRLREAEIDLAIKEFEVLRAKIAAFLALASCDV